MDRRKTISLAMCVALVGGVGVGCSDLPGDKESQGAVIGGVTGAAAGAISSGRPVSIRAASSVSCVPSSGLPRPMTTRSAKRPYWATQALWLPCSTTSTLRK